MKPAPLKDKDEGENGYFWKEDVAALKLWLESKDLKGPFGFVMISKEDWKEGWSDVNK